MLLVVKADSHLESATLANAGWQVKLAMRNSLPEGVFLAFPVQFCMESRVLLVCEDWELEAWSQQHGSSSKTCEELK